MNKINTHIGNNTIKGNLSTERIFGKISNNNFNCNISDNKISCSELNSAKIKTNITSSAVIINKITVGGQPTYHGTYTAIPDDDESVMLYTKGMILKEDIVVVPIPKYEVSNISGTTYIIGT